MSREISPDRLGDLLVDPREALDLELKNWLDLQGDRHHKAILAKAAMALANHGGGFILLGFEDGPDGVVEADNRPDAMTAYSQDVVNGIVEHYCEPSFHCEVGVEASPAGSEFPVVKVPGGHRVPVRAKRSGPGESVFHENDIYVRKPGPRSEVPRSAQDWDELLSRCLENRRDELASLMRRVLAGLEARPQPPDPDERLDRWAHECFRRWSKVVENLPPDVGARFPCGHYSFAYEVVGGARNAALQDLPDVLRASVVRHSGWPPFWYPTRVGIAPYPSDGAVECWLGEDQEAALACDAAHADFWRITPDALAYLIRGYQEDGSDMERAGRRVAPGTVFDVNLPVWRTGEALLHAARFSKKLVGHPATIRFVAHYTGLSDRTLVSHANTRRFVGREYVSREGSIRCAAEVESEAITANLPEIVHELLAPLYTLFGFFKLPTRLVAEELGKMRSSGF